MILFWNLKCVQSSWYVQAQWSTYSSCFWNRCPRCTKSSQTGKLLCRTKLKEDVVKRTQYTAVLWQFTLWQTHLHVAVHVLERISYSVEPLVRQIQVRHVGRDRVHWAKHARRVETNRNRSNSERPPAVAATCLILFDHTTSKFIFRVHYIHGHTHSCVGVLKLAPAASRARWSVVKWRKFTL